MVKNVHSAIEVFYSYASNSKDDKWQSEIEKQLSTLKRSKLITDWHARKISPGLDWQKETSEHLNSATLILLLISPDFIASHYCYGIEMKRALERHEAGDARVVPIILRPTDWKGTPFEHLAILPKNKKPITIWSNRDAALLDVAKGIREAIEDLNANALAFRNNEQYIAADESDHAFATMLAEKSKDYCATLFERWKMLDFKGIMHIDMNRPISIPLIEVFVPPKVLVGVPEYETVEREDLYESEPTLHKDDEDSLEEPRQEGKRLILQREDISVILAKFQRLIFLGDPGSGKSTLLRYLLLQAAQGRFPFLMQSQNVNEVDSMIPLYIPLSSYAEACLLNPPGERSLKAFLPQYLQDNYLEDYIELVQLQLQRGRVLLLLDGLDEIPEAALRMKVVRQIELFTQFHPKNRFIITSRIVGYKEAKLSTDYQAYTLADFDEEQIRMFTTRWCPMYERWVKGTQDSEHLQELATREATKLFHATQRKPAVKRLAANPLLLTILALIQRQGIELPSHRIELFNLCADTLLDTWIKAKELIESTHFSKNDLIKILRPLAFWMHEHPAVGAIPEEELIDQIVQQLLARKITRHADEAHRLAQEFLITIRGKTGILVERGKQRYGFLHLTFEEYFAAKELEKRKEREDFIKTHLHASRWREVILLTIGDVGILQSKEEEVTELIQNAILHAGSPYEEWIHRDLFFAGICLADDVGASNECEEAIIQSILHLYLLSPYNALRNDIVRVLNAWSDTKIAAKVTEQVKPLAEFIHRVKKLLTNRERTYSISNEYNKTWLGQQFVSHITLKTFQEDELKHLYLRVITILCILHVDAQDWVKYAFELLDDPDQKRIQEISQALGWLAGKDVSVLEKLLPFLSHHSWQVKQTVARALGQSGTNDPRVINALLSLLEDYDVDVRKATVRALGQTGSHDRRVIEALIRLLQDADSQMTWSAANALGQMSVIDQSTIETLLQLLADPDADVIGAAARGLGLMKISEPRVVDALLQLLAPSWLRNGVRAVVLNRRGLVERYASPVGELSMQLLTPSVTPKDVELDIVQGQERADVIARYIPLLLNSSHSSTQAKNAEGENDYKHLLVVDVNNESDFHELAINRYYAGRITLLGTALSQNRFSSALKVSSAHLALEELLHLHYFERPNLLLDKNDFSWPSRLRRVSIALKGENPYSRAFFQPYKFAYRLNYFPYENASDYISAAENTEWLIKQASMLEWSMRYMDVEIMRYVASCSWSAKQSVYLSLKRTNDPNEKIQQAAAEALGRVGGSDPRVVSTLLSLVSDEKANTSMRSIIVEALGLVGTGNPNVVQVLLALLSGAAPEVKRAAVKALGQLGDGNAHVVEALHQQLLEADPAMKRVTSSALALLAVDREAICRDVEQSLTHLRASLMSVKTAQTNSMQSAEDHLDALLFALQQLTTETS